MSLTINDVHLGTKNLTLIQDFFERYFDFKKKFDHDPRVFLENDSGFLLAIDPVNEVPQLPDWYHLGFCLDNEAQVFSIYEKMKSGDVEIVRDMKSLGGQFASFFIKDPDGNKIEVSWHNHQELK